MSIHIALFFVLLGTLAAALILCAVFYRKWHNLIKSDAELKQRLRRTTNLAHSFLLDSIIELRRPLQGLDGVRDLYGVDAKNPEVKDYIEVVDHCTQHLMDQLDRLQMFSEASLTSLEQKPTRFIVRDLIQAGIKKATSRLVGRSASITKKIDTQVPESASGPVHLLEPMIVELIDSALRASASARLVLNISRDALAPHMLNISIHDEVGFSEKFLAEMVQEVSSSQSDSPWSGKALGLAIPLLRNLTQSLKARAWVQPGGPGQVSLNLSVPLSMEPIATQAQTTSPEVTSHFHLPSNKILVVDDEPIVRNLLSSILHRMGHNVTVATNGHEAIELCRRHLFGVVFMDMDMPVLDGWSASDTILNKLHLPHPPKIIAVTSHSQEEHRKRGLDLGMYAYLAKPVGAKELQTLLEGLGVEPENAKPKTNSNTKESPEAELASAYAVDFNRMYHFYSEDFNLCKQVLLQAKVALPEFLVKVERAIIQGDMKSLKHALHQLKGEFAICMCTPGVSLTERMMVYDQVNSIEFLSDFEELNKLIDRIFHEIDELIQAPSAAA